jgi:hypothetical protein
MTLWGWNLAVISKGLSRSQPPVHEPTLSSPEPMLEPPPHRRRPKPVSHQPSAKDHAEALLDWIRRNVDPSSGPIFHFVMLEYYTEMLLERGWRELKWNPVAHQFRLLTTGEQKTYAWVQTTTGTPHRLRVYPIPPAACLTGSPVVPSSVRSSFRRGAPKLRRAA